MTDDLGRGAWSPRPTNGPSLPGHSLSVDIQHSPWANPHEGGGDRHVDLTGTLTNWLRELAQRFKRGDRPDRVVGPFGYHTMRYGEDDEDGYGPYAVVSFSFSEPHDLGWFSEIEDGTYGQLMGFRIYLDEIGNA
jgi:hypothetical protein